MKTKKVTNESTIEHAVLVYQQTKRPFKKRVFYMNSHTKIDECGWKHVATLDPATWIECLLNIKNKLNFIKELNEA